MKKIDEYSTHLKYNNNNIFFEHKFHHSDKIFELY